MAFVDPNEISPAVGTQQPQGQQSQQAPVAAGGQGVASSTKAASTPGINFPQQPSAQLKDYLSANQPQTAAYAGNIAGTLGGQTAAAGNAINPAVNTYTGQLYTVPTDTGTNQTVATSPSALTPQQTSTFQTELGAAANAPNSANTFESTAPYQGLVSNIQQAVEQANLWNAGNNVSSISTAVTPFEGPNATSGDKTLDALLISQSPQAYNQITGAVAPAANLQGQLSAGASQADTALQNAIAQDTAATTAAQNSAQTYSQNLTNYLNNAVSSDQALNAQYGTLKKDLLAGTPTQQDLETLGMSPQQWATLQSEIKANATDRSNFGYSNLADYLTMGTPGTISASTEANAKNYADVAALANLMGSNAPTELISPTTANEAGTVNMSAPALDLGRAELNAQVNDLVAQINNTINTANSAVDQYNNGNHFGGQSPQQMNDYIAGLQNTVNQLEGKLGALTKGPIDINTITGLTQPAPSYQTGDEIGAAVGSGIGSVVGAYLAPGVGAYPGAMAGTVIGGLGADQMQKHPWEQLSFGPLTAIPGIENFAQSGAGQALQGIFNPIIGIKDVANWLGFAHGGEVKKNNIAEYLGAS